MNYNPSSFLSMALAEGLPGAVLDAIWNFSNENGNGACHPEGKIKKLRGREDSDSEKSTSR